MTPGMRAAMACLVAGLGGCGGSGGLPMPSPQVSTPTVPAPVPPPGTGVSVLADGTLSGRVYELVGDARQMVGIENVAVYCEQCGESTHSYAYTDARGEYVFPPGVWTEGRPASFPARILVRKDGYEDPPGLPKTTPPNPTGAGWREVAIVGDTRFEMELVRR